MPDYRQQEGTAISWRRSNAVSISNTFNQVPSISFQEEDVVTVGDRQFNTPAMSTVSCLFNSTAVIPLVNPETGELTGASVTHRDFYVLLHSLYIQQALLRDAAAVAAP